LTLNHLAENPRVTIRRPGEPLLEGTCVVYWMQRSQRALDNPALDLAVEAANLLGKPVVVFFAPVPFYPHANLCHYNFLAEAIPDTAERLAKRNIGFVLRRYPDHSLLRFCDEVKPALVIGDENPLRETEHWRQLVTRKLCVPLWTVDSDVAVPGKVLNKRFTAARFIRPSIQAHLNEFLVPGTNPKAKHAWTPPKNLRSLVPDFDILRDWPLDRSVSPVSSFRGGTTEALLLLKQFTSGWLRHYDTQRNHPEVDGTSSLSPYLHFGHISPITVALAVKESGAPAADKNAFLDQLITWRELAINFVRFDPEYDNFQCAEPWALKTLAEHARDRRPFLYSRSELESAETHDELWNAAQRQMLETGWMHNYMRMYWAKKILEWSANPHQAYETAVYLNDKYFLDGRDPNGYLGIAWAIVGKMDRPWFRRPIFGLIRYMSHDSAVKKFNAHRYISQYTQLRLTGTD
jgi:deoxyribodipyrimidine photo-lyase